MTVVLHGSTAQIWEFWRRGRWLLFTNVLGVTVLHAFVYAMSGGGTPVLVRQSQIAHPVFSALFAVTAFLLILAVCSATGSNRGLYTFPVTSWAIAGWPMLAGMTVTVAAYLLIASGLNVGVRAAWPLIKPAIGAAALYAWCQVLVWWLARVQRFHYLVAALSSATVVLSATAGVFQDGGDFWHRDSRFETIGLLGSLPAAYLVAVYGTWRARQGEQISFAGLYDRLRGLPRRLAPTADWSAPQSAELWRDWAEKGAIFPMAVAAGSALAVAYTLVARIGFDRETEPLAIGFTLWIVAGPLVGLYVGHCGDRFDIRPFKSTQPLSDTNLADVILWNCARVVVFSWLVVGAAAALQGLGLTWLGEEAGAWPLARNLPGGDGQWDTRTGWPLLSTLCVILAHWTLMVLGANAALIRQRAFMGALSAGVVLLWLAFVGLVHPASTRIVQRVLLAGFVVGVPVAVLVIYTAATYLRLVSYRRIALAVSCYAATCLVGALVIGPQVSGGEWLLPAMTLASSSLLAWLPLAGLPLAVWWNRHR